MSFFRFAYTDKQAARAIARYAFAVIHAAASLRSMASRIAGACLLKAMPPLALCNAIFRLIVAMSDALAVDDEGGIFSNATKNAKISNRKSPTYRRSRSGAMTWLCVKTFIILSLSSISSPLLVYCFYKFF